MFEGVRSRSVTEIERVVLHIYTQNTRHGGGGGGGDGGGGGGGSGGDCGAAGGGGEGGWRTTGQLE